MPVVSNRADSRIPPHLRRNFALGVVNGALYIVAESLIDPALVLTWFLARLSASNLLIGLVVPLRDAGWFLPQLFAAHYLATLAAQAADLHGDVVGPWPGLADDGDRDADTARSRRS